MRALVEAWAIVALQLHYWRDVIPAMSRHSGYTALEMHEALLRHLYGRLDIEIRSAAAWRDHIRDAQTVAAWLGVPEARAAKAAQLVVTVHQQ